MLAWRVSASQAAARERHSCPAHSFVEKKFPIPLIRQLLVKEWTLNTGKLNLGGLPRNSVIK